MSCALLLDAPVEDRLEIPGVVVTELDTLAVATELATLVVVTEVATLVKLLTELVSADVVLLSILDMVVDVEVYCKVVAEDEIVEEAEGVWLSGTEDDVELSVVLVPEEPVLVVNAVEL